MISDSFVFFLLSHSQYKQDEWQSACLILLDATGFVEVPWVLKDRLDKLAKQALHVVLTTGKQTLQEGDVSTVSRQQQGDIWQALDYGQREGCEGRKYVERKKKKRGQI